jgi:hypothetical protein
MLARWSKRFALCANVPHLAMEPPDMGHPIMFVLQMWATRPRCGEAGAVRRGEDAGGDQSRPRARKDCGAGGERVELRASF